MLKLCDIVCDLLIEESNIQPVYTPVTVCGDIHGQASSMMASADASLGIVDTLMGHRMCQGEAESFAKRAVESLIKKLKEKRDLECLVTTKGTRTTECVVIPRTIDGRIQVAGRKLFPHLLYVRIWRYPDVKKNELNNVDYCNHGFNSESEKVCINPYHYERVLCPRTAESPYISDSDYLGRSPSPTPSSALENDKPMQIDTVVSSADNSCSNSGVSDCSFQSTNLSVDFCPEQISARSSSFKSSVKFPSFPSSFLSKEDLEVLSGSHHRISETKLMNSIFAESENKEIDTQKQTISKLQKENKDSASSKLEIEKKASTLADELKTSHENSQQLSSKLKELENRHIKSEHLQSPPASTVEEVRRRRIQRFCPEAEANTTSSDQNNDNQERPA